MFSPRLFAVLLVCAGASALPARDQPIAPPITTITDDQFTFPWLNLSPFSLFAPLWKLIPTFVDIGPRIYADEKQFQVVINVKDYLKENLKVRVKGDFIFVQGSQEAKDDDHDLFASNFLHTYSKSANMSAAAVTAKLTSDKFLVITAPIGDKVDETTTERVVPIEETGAPYKKEEDEKTTETVEVKTTERVDVPTTQEPKTSAPVTATSEAEEKKETTAAPEQDEATEKDNVIPHGNEVTA